MNLNDLMEVWRSQDAAPLHGVNETLLRLALRQDEAKLRATRRREMWFAYIGMAVLVGLMALFLVVMIYPYDDFTSQKRTPKLSAQWFRETARRNAVV